MTKKYNYLIVGSGLFGAVFAHEAAKAGKKCLVIDRRKHIGGNVYCENIEDINVHKYGPHIFHTNDLTIWNYVRQFTEFNNFVFSPMANYKGKIFNLPFNMNTFKQLWGVQSPAEAYAKIQAQIVDLNIGRPQNLEQQALKLLGTDIYETLIKGYSEKQWGKLAKDLPSFLIKRLPIRFTYDNNYFDDKYQGIPIGGYNTLITGLLKGIDCKTNVDFFENKFELENIAEKTVFTGKIDEYFNYSFGELEYRSLHFETQILNKRNFQYAAVINYTDYETEYTRIIEHKHFEFGNQSKTVITREFPLRGSKNNEAYYPVNDKKNSDLYKKYELLAKQHTHIIFGGRLAEYRYYDMHQVIASALSKIKRELLD